MPNIKLVIEYDGGAFHGWQEQPGVRTIQAELHRVLETVLRERIHSVHASGRTDAGVHAGAQVVNFHCEQSPDLRRLTHAVSSLLKGELSVLDARHVPDSFHARFSAVAKQYSYYILNRGAPAVLNRGRVWHISRCLDVARMQSECRYLIGQHDFSSFRGSGCMANSPIRKIFESRLEQEGDVLHYTVRGEGFLKQMVRNIVGSLVAIGERRPDALPFAELLALRDRRRAGVTAPPYGLILDEVEYSDDSTLVPAGTDEAATNTIGNPK